MSDNRKDVTKDYYAILEVPVDATSQDIKRAWREQLQVWHPDRFMHNASLLTKAEARSKEINEAYAILVDDDKRRLYDESRQGDHKIHDDKGGQANIVPMADFVIPFDSDIQSLEQSVYAYMIEGKYVPDDLIQRAEISKQDHLYLPCYLFHGSFIARWTATFGYDRKEDYTEYQNQYDSQTRQNRRVPVTRTRTVTDWHPHSGTATGNFAVMTYAGSQLNDSILPLVENRDQHDSVSDFDPSSIKGVEVEPFTVSANDAYATKADPAITKIIDANVRQHAQGDRQRDWHWKGDLKPQSRKGLVPIVHTVFEYHGKKYNVWVDGANPTRRLGDALPTDKNKLHAVIYGFIPAIISLLSVALSYLVFQEKSNAAIFLSIPTVCLVYGLLRRKFIVDYSRTLRQLLLKERVASAKFERPSKPFFANTSHDTILIPILSVILPLCILLPAWVATGDSNEQPVQNLAHLVKKSKDEATASTVGYPSKAKKENVQPEAGLSTREKDQRQEVLSNTTTLFPESNVTETGYSQYLEKIRRETDYSQYLEKARGELAAETNALKVEQLQSYIARTEERQRVERMTPEELLAHGEAMQCTPQDGMCDAMKGSYIMNAKTMISTMAHAINEKRDYLKLVEKSREREEINRRHQLP